ERLREAWRSRVGQVPELITAEVSLDCIVACEGEVGVDIAAKLRSWGSPGNDPEIPRCFTGVKNAGAQSDTRVRRWRRRPAHRLHGGRRFGIRGCVCRRACRRARN